MPELDLGVIGNSSVAALINRRGRIEGMRARRNDLGLVGLIVCAMRLSKSWEEAFWRGW